jgi:hypothetical protein
LNLATLSTWWTNDCARFGLEGFTLHELRHTYLVVLAMNSVHPKVMQELAGHSDPTMAMRIYAHVNLDATRRRRGFSCGESLPLAKAFMPRNASPLRALESDLTPHPSVPYAASL